ncbi:hypothetical protein FOL46_002878 [Perkinsus olseni]|uniref:CS domain-containing protein n=1 Tax=Perkinsus olseni TaxID=32597 RepID=A0A7J6M5C2_PEROL|nr:hypothetical protein FOL46_002878 [Perkinsus olseni]
MPRGIDYKWSEDLKCIFITFTGIVGVKMQNLDVQLADVFLKVNHAPSKQLQVIDLRDSVDISTSSTVIHGSSVQVQLTKCSPKIWGCLEYTDEDVRVRRAESLARAEMFEKGRIESAAKARQEQVKHSEQMQWKEDRESRELFEKKRLDAKTAAENQVYEDLAEIGVQDAVVPPDEGGHVKPETNTEGLRLYESEDSDSEAGDSDEPKVVEVLTSGRGGPSGETTPAEEHLQAPIRNQGDRSVKIGLEFTKRRQVGVPARDRPGREAPRPRADATGIMGVSQRSGETDAEENFPMMLKTRGDKMMSNGDFKGAGLKARRLAATRYTGRLSPACEDCRHALAALDLQLKHQTAGIVGGAVIEPEESKRTRAVIYSRLAVASLWLGRFEMASEAASKAEEIARACLLFSEEERGRIASDKRRISDIIERIWTTKKAADELYRQRGLAEAVDQYEKLISSIDRNPILLANLSQFKLQQGEFERTINLVDEALEATWSIPCVGAGMNPAVPPKYEAHLHQLLTDPLTFNDSAVDPTAAQWLMKREGCDLKDLPEVPPEFEWVRSGGQDKNWIAVRKKPSEKTVEDVKACVADLQDAVTSRIPARIRGVAEKHGASEYTTVQKAVMDALRYAADLENALKMREESEHHLQENISLNDLLGTGAFINKHPICVNRRKLFTKLQLRWSTAAVRAGNKQEEAIGRLRKVISIDRDNKEAMLLISRLLAKQDTEASA